MQQNPSVDLCPIAKSLEDSEIAIQLNPHIKVVFNKPCPLVLSPKNKTPPNFIYLQQYFFRNHKNILLAASQYGAVVFQNFDIQNAQQWASILYNSGLKQMQAIGGAAVRRLIVGSEDRFENIQVVTANQAKSSAPIWFHHQQAQLPNPPSHVAFFCLVNATLGGATPLIRSDFIFDYLQTNFSDFTKKIEQVGVIYQRIVPYYDDASSAQGRSWRSMFQVSNVEEAEVQMTKREFKWKWELIKSQNQNQQKLYDLRLITKPLSAVRLGTNGKKVFFNQVIAAYKGWKDPDNIYAKPLRFGDGSNLPNDVLQSLDSFIQDQQVIYPWQPGQFCIVDNMTACHARQPFEGKRIVVAAIVRGTKQVTPPQNIFVLSSGDIVPAYGIQLTHGKRWVHINLGQECKKQQQQMNGNVFLTASVGCDMKLQQISDVCKKFLQSSVKSYIDICFLQAGAMMLQRWKLIESLKEIGVVRNIGLVNGDQQLVNAIVDDGSYSKPVANLINDRSCVSKEFMQMLRFNRKKGILTITSGQINDKLLKQAAINDIAKRNNTDAKIVMLRWAFQKGIASIIDSKELLKCEEAEVNFKLNADDVLKIDSIIQQT